MPENLMESDTSQAVQLKCEKFELAMRPNCDQLTQLFAARNKRFDSLVTDPKTPLSALAPPGRAIASRQPKKSDYYVTGPKGL
jgi:hypothetical protein